MNVPARPSSVSPVALAEIAAVVNLQTAAVPDVTVTGVSLSSATVAVGDLYAALPGARTHGAEFAAAAAAAGAVAVLTDAAGAERASSAGLPTLVIDEPRGVLGYLAALVYGHPADSLTLIGVTGTTGKTTTTHLIAAGLEGADRRTAVIGTTGTLIDGKPVASSLTTPEAPDLHALFAVMREQGVEVCAMEVSSHSLVMGRVDGVVFDLAVFTNLGRDHLDFHADADDYFSAKAQLFTAKRARRALVNLDDSHGAILAANPQIPTETWSITGQEADWRAVIDDADSRAHGSSFDVTGPGGVKSRAFVPMVGTFNVANALGALAACVTVGCEVSTTVRGLSEAPSVPGRMERVDVGQDFTVVVDYAHKPDALQAALQALRPVTPGRLIVVVGAGGDRDRGKRPLMGEIAARLADVVVITDDNPRNEDAATIRAELLAGALGVEGSADVNEVGDRGKAISCAIARARRGDTVLVAGKGHETGQESAGTVLPFDDRLEALAQIHARAASAQS